MDFQPGLVSVIIVNYNGQKWLSRCLGSVLAQTYEPLEVVLVDNGSSDQSVSYVRGHFPSVRVVESPKNLGFSGGNNLGVAQSHGEYVMLLNNDTWIGEDLVFGLVQRLNQEKLVAVAPVARLYDGKVYHARHASSKIDVFGHPVIVHDGQPFYLSGVCVLFRKDTYLNAGGLDGDFFMYSEEIDWFWRLNLLGLDKYRYFDDLIVYHAGTGGTLGQIKYLNFLWRNQNCLQMLLKNYALHNLLWVLPLYFLQNLAEILVFLLVLKPKIAYSYPAGWWFNIVHLRRTLEKRRVIQAGRIASDAEIMKKMYLGPGKLLHLVTFLMRRVLRRP